MSPGPVDMSAPPASEPLSGPERGLELLVLNLALDVNDTALGFTTAWTNALARRCRHVSVITMRTGELALEPNVSVYSLGKERGFSEPRRLIEFYRHAWAVLRERRIDACFAHMAPLFAALFAPLAKARGIPMLLWYAHGARTRRLRIAHAFADRAVTPTVDAFNIPSDKLHVIGHGIDVERFQPPAEVSPDYVTTAISIGRMSRSKRLDEMITALAVLRERHGVDLRLELTGEPLTADDRHYEQELRQTTESLGLADAVRFTGPVPFPEVPARYHHGGLFLNLSETRSIDKAILESMASGCVPISRNASFEELARRHGLESLVPGPGPESVAEAIARALAMSAADRTALVQKLRSIVVREHGLDALIDTLIRHLAELAA